MGQVQLSIDGPLARVTLSHEGKFNAMSRAMWRELAATFRHLPPSRSCCRRWADSAPYASDPDVAAATHAGCGRDAC